MAKILTKKVKVQVRASQTLIFLALSQQKVKVWQTFTWTFTFLVGIFAILGELSSFSLLGGTSSILRTFLGGTSEKTHPVHFGVWKYQSLISVVNLFTFYMLQGLAAADPMPSSNLSATKCSSSKVSNLESECLTITLGFSFYLFICIDVTEKFWDFQGCDRRHYTLFYINVLKIDIICIIFHF